MAFCKLPSGVQDILPEECGYLETLRFRLTEKFVKSGYEPVRSAAVEYYDTYSHIRNVVPQERMFKFTDTDGQLLVLRPDATLSISRIAATKLAGASSRLYYFSDKWEARGTGGLSSREVYQAGVERLGEEGAFSDAQTVAFAVECLKETGLKNFILDLGHVGFFKGLLEGCGLSAEEAEEVRSHINRKDSLNAELVLKKAGAKINAVNAVLALPTLFGGAEVLSRAERFAETDGAKQAVKHLKAVYTLLEAMGYGDFIRFDLGAVKSLSYYSGIIFSGLVEKLGAPVLSGGRYDFLADDFGKHIPAVGFALGLKRILIALERQGGLPEKRGFDYVVAYEAGAETAAYNAFEDYLKKGYRVHLCAAAGKSAAEGIGGTLVYVTKGETA